MWWMLLALAQANTPDPVAVGWYRWQTGQIDQAEAAGIKALAASPESYAAWRLNLAMRVEGGDGATAEAEVRQWWSESREDPLRRVALATILSFRHDAKGGWCDEVKAMVAPLPKGEARYWGLLADRQRELRCVGSTDHTDGQLRKLGGEGVGFVDGVMAELDAKYIKQGFPERLEKALAEEPHRLENVGTLWDKYASGPALGAARSVAMKALKAAAENKRPEIVYAAYRGYRGAGKEKPLEDLAARVKRLDRDADLSLTRTIDDVADPPIYGEIDECVDSVSFGEAEGCLDSLSVPTGGGSIEAYAASQRAQLYEAMGRDEDAAAAWKAAFEADPRHTFNARRFLKLAVAAGEGGELAMSAANAVIGKRLPRDLEEVTDEQRKPLADDLTLRARVSMADGDSDAALNDVRLAALLDPTPLRHLWLGNGLVGAGEVDAGVMHLAWALGQPSVQSETELVSSMRELLAEHSEGWNPQGMEALLQQAMLAPGHKKDLTPDVVGNVVKLSLPETDESPLLTVVVPWNSWWPNQTGVGKRIDGLKKLYAERKVRFVLLDVDEVGGELEETDTENVYVGPSAMRALKLSVLPSVVVLDKRGKAIGAVAAWSKSSQDLESLLDENLPPVQ